MDVLLLMTRVNTQSWGIKKIKYFEVKSSEETPSEKKDLLRRRKIQ